MATIVSRKRGDGTTAHMARIIIKRKGKVIFSDNRTFDRKQTAYAWAEAREKELNAPGGLEKRSASRCTSSDFILVCGTSISAIQGDGTLTRYMSQLSALAVSHRPTH